MWRVIIAVLAHGVDVLLAQGVGLVCVGAWCWLGVFDNNVDPCTWEWVVMLQVLVPIAWHATSRHGLQTVDTVSMFQVQRDSSKDEG